MLYSIFGLLTLERDNEEKKEALRVTLAADPWMYELMLEKFFKRLEELLKTD